MSVNRFFSESLAHFLIGEGKLEAHLEEWPPTKENIERAQRELSDARGYLSLATDEAGKKAGVALDAHLLLGKLNYACGSYDEALKHFRLAELNTLTEKDLPVYVHFCLFYFLYISIGFPEMKSNQMTALIFCSYEYIFIKKCFRKSFLHILL